MKVLGYLAEQIEEEQEDAIEYLEHAMKYKESYPRLADGLVELARQETSHAATLRDHARQIAEKHKKDGQYPEGLNWAMEREREHYIKRDMHIRMLMDAYKA